VLPEGIPLPKTYLFLKSPQDSALNTFRQDETEIGRVAAFPLVLKWISKTSFARIERFEGTSGTERASAIAEMDAASLIMTGVLSHSHLDTSINREAAAAINDQLGRLAIDQIDSTAGKSWDDLEFLY
jgi:hypothetical protein